MTVPLALRVATGFARRELRQCSFPALGQVAAQEMLVLRRSVPDTPRCRRRAVPHRQPRARLPRSAACPYSAATSSGTKNFGSAGHPSSLLRLGQLVLAQRFAVDAGGAGLVGASVADHGLAADDARPRIGLRRRHRLRDGPVSSSVHRLHMPAVGVEALGPILAIRQARAAFNGNAIVVVQIDQVARAR